MESKLDATKKMVASLRNDNAELQEMVVNLHQFAKSLHKLILVDTQNQLPPINETEKVPVDQDMDGAEPGPISEYEVDCVAPIETGVVSDTLEPSLPNDIIQGVQEIQEEYPKMNSPEMV